MPPEPVPFDRKDFAARERKQQERGASAVASPSFSTERLRNQYTSPSHRHSLPGHELGSCRVTPSRSEGEGWFKNRKSPLQRPDYVASTDPLSSLKEHRDKCDGGGNDGPQKDSLLGPIKMFPLKWSRSCSFSSSTKHMRSEADGSKADASCPPGKDGFARAVTSPETQSDEGNARKKPRLGWGQGLMKYEKQKDGPEDGLEKNMATQGSASGTKITTTETSTRLVGLSGSASPATPSSINCGFSHVTALEDKQELTTANNDGGGHNDSEAHEPGRSLEVSIDLEHFNAISPSYVTSLIADVLQTEDICTGDSSTTKQSASNKLLLLKDDILKVLEKTVVDTDLLENELKNLELELSRSCVFPGSQPEAGTLSMIDCNISSCGPTEDTSCKYMSSETPPKKDVFLDNFPAEIKEKEPENRTDISSKLINSDLEKRELVNNVQCKVQNYEYESMENQISLPIAPDEATKNMANTILEDNDKIDLGVCKNNDEMNDTLIAQIIASNRESAKKASDRLGKWCPSITSPYEGKSQSISKEMKKKMAMRTKYLKFKERALTLKYRAFHHSWKENPHSPSFMKYCSKSQKHGETGVRSHYGYSKLKTSSDMQSPPGSSTIMPTEEVSIFTSKLLSDSKARIHRKFLKMPALILSNRDRMNSRFISKNGLVEDPVLIEKEKVIINPWTAEEKKTFLEIFGIFGKDFKKIATFLDHKTTADCVEYYYKNHKSEGFELVKNKLKQKKKCHSLPSKKYMVPSEDTSKHESDTTPLDLLGEASLFVAYSNDYRLQQKVAGRSVLGSPKGAKISCGTYTRASSDDIHAETTAADVLAGIGNSISSEGMGSCITTSVDYGEKLDFPQVDRPFYPEVTQMIDETTCSDEDFDKPISVDWTDEERSLFIKALSLYGKDFTRISDFLGTRSEEQCKIFFCKGRKCLGLDMLYQGSFGNNGGVHSNKEGRSETDDACVAEIDSAICSIQSSSMLDDFTLTMGETGSKEFQEALNTHHQTDMAIPDSGQYNKEVKIMKVNRFSSDKKLSAKNEAKHFLEGFSVSSLRDKVSGRPHSAPNGGINKHLNDLISLDPVFSVSGAKCKTQCDDMQKGGSYEEAAVEQVLDAKSNVCPQGKMHNSPCGVFSTNRPNLVQTSLSYPGQKNLVLQKQDNCDSVSTELASSRTSFTKIDDHLVPAKQSPIVHGDHSKSNCTDSSKYCLLENGYSAWTSQHMHDLKGYHLHKLNGNGMVGDTTKFQMKMSIPNLPKINENLDEKASNTMHKDVDLSIPFVERNTDSSDNQLRPCSQISDSETMEQGAGDFKLFGKILTHPSSLKKAEEGDNKSPSLKPSRLSLKLPGEKAEKTFIPPPTGVMSNTVLNELPLRTIKFWDGRRIQIGLSSLPEPALIMSRCPAALEGMTYYNSKENSGGNKLPIHQHSFSIGGNQDVLRELQKRPRLDSLSGFHQQEKMGDSGGSIAGISCTGVVSDPVAAIRLCYASQTGLVKKNHADGIEEVASRLFM